MLKAQPGRIPVHCKRSNFPFGVAMIITLQPKRLTRRSGSSQRRSHTDTLFPAAKEQKQIAFSTDAACTPCVVSSPMRERAQFIPATTHSNAASQCRKEIQCPVHNPPNASNDLCSTRPGCVPPYNPIPLTRSSAPSTAPSSSPTLLFRCRFSSLNKLTVSHATLASWPWQLAHPFAPASSPEMPLRIF